MEAGINLLWFYVTVVAIIVFFVVSLWLYFKWETRKLEQYVRRWTDNCCANFDRISQRIEEEIKRVKQERRELGEKLEEYLKGGQKSLGVFREGVEALLRAINPPK